MAQGNETITLKLPSGEEVDVVVPAGMSDQQVHQLMQQKHPEFFEKDAAAPPPPDNRSFLEKAATQPTQFSRSNPLRYFDELGQGMAQGAEALIHPWDTAKKMYKSATTDNGPTPDISIGELADQVVQGWGQAATIAPIARGVGEVVKRVPEVQSAMRPSVRESGLPPVKPPTVPAEALGKAWTGERTGLPYQPNPRYAPPPPAPAPLPPRTGPLLLQGEVMPELGSPANPGIHSKIPLRVPRSVLEEERVASPVGSPENPGPHAKLPMRVPRKILDAEEEAKFAERGAESNRDATLDRRNIPPYAGEEEAISSSSNRPGLPRIGGRRMSPPLRPLVGTPEDWQTYDQQKAILRPEAQDAGLFSAARGKVSPGPDYQMRIGGKLNPFGSESPAPSGELSPPSTLRPYSPDPGTRSPDFDLHQQATERAVSEMKSGTLPEGMTTAGRAQQILDELKKAQ